MCFQIEGKANCEAIDNLYFETKWLLVTILTRSTQIPLYASLDEILEINSLHNLSIVENVRNLKANCEALADFGVANCLYTDIAFDFENPALTLSRLSSKHNWLKEIKVPERKVVFVNTDNILNKYLNMDLNKMRNKNFYESAIIHAIVENFLVSGLNRKQIAVVTPFLD